MVRKLEQTTVDDQDTDFQLLVQAVVKGCSCGPQLYVLEVIYAGFFLTNERKSSGKRVEAGTSLKKRTGGRDGIELGISSRLLVDVGVHF